ncbi:MAG TPA: CmcI family methyltransferase, partial [Methanocella sp.]
IYRLKPDVIVETGVAHGGSLILYASLMRSVGKGRVLGIDIEIKPHNRKAIETHELAEYITLIEGSSTDPAVIQKVRSLIKPGETVMVVLDSNHSKRHVFEELEQYHSLVTPGSYIVATDGIMKDLCDVPSGKDSWAQDNPCEAAREFLKIHPEFALEPPAWSFNESKLDASITYWPDSWLKKRA